MMGKIGQESKKSENKVDEEEEPLMDVVPCS